MEVQMLDIVLVPLGLIIMGSYHLWLLIKIMKEPTKTVIGIHAIHTRFWVCAIMEETPKNAVLAVQTLRNNIMASTLLASTAITLSSVIVTLSSVIAFLMTSRGGSQSEALGLVFGDHSLIGFFIKFFTILVCFFLAFLFNVLSIRYYNLASTLINVPLKKMASPFLTAAYVGRIVNKGAYFWSLGLRAFYFAFPLFLWIFGPIPMFFSCLALVFLFYFLDFTLDFVAISHSECVFSYIDLEQQQPQQQQQQQQPQQQQQQQ